MVIGVLKEQLPETRVSLVPEVVVALVKLNVTVWVEAGAGDTAFFSDKSYTDAGAEIKDAAQIRSSADIVLTIQAANAGTVKPGAVLMGIYQPLFAPGAHAAMGGERIYCFQPRYYSPHHARTVYGCAELAGKYCGL